MSNSNGHRWSKFCWRDWSSDRLLHPCSLAARGLWIELLCIMHEGSPVGHLTLGGKPMTLRQIAANACCSEKDAKKYLAELEAAGVFSRTADGTIYSRRMVKDVERSETGKAWGKTGGNPQLLKEEDNSSPPPTRGVNPPLNPKDNQPHNQRLNGEVKSGVIAKSTDSELESKKEDSGNIIYLKEESLSRGRAREAAPLSSDPKTASLLKGLGRELRNWELAPGQKPRFDRFTQSDLMRPRLGAKHLTPEQLLLTRKRARA